MRFRTSLLYYSPQGQPAPDILEMFARERGLELERPASAAELLAHVNRAYPAAIVLGTQHGDESIPLCDRLKSDPFSAIIPIVFSLPEPSGTLVLEALEAGADEVLIPLMSAREQMLRLHMTMQRADRDVSVHPTTRLPGTVLIERDIGERIRSGEFFAVCYADLDHFKEYNDHHGYNEGDSIILLLSKILRDVVKSYSPTGFIGHIGGDDFIFNVPLDIMPTCCEEILAIFDELIPFQYNEEVRERGYFEGKDRRGNVYQVPLMTLSIGVVTNRKRVFTHTARVSELATEMKSYAKTLPGSVYAVDRRSDEPPALAEQIAAATPGLEPHSQT